MISSSWGSMVVDNSNAKEWTWHNLSACTKYFVHIAPVFNDIVGQAKEVSFVTFPNEEAFEVFEADDGIEFTEDGLSNCNSVNYITYKISVRFNAAESRNESQTVVEGILKKRAPYYEIAETKGVQTFTIENILQEIVTLGMLGSCKSYVINITAEIEGN
jgi:hypothetical protein